MFSLSVWTASGSIFECARSSGKLTVKNNVSPPSSLESSAWMRTKQPQQVFCSIDLAHLGIFVTFGKHHLPLVGVLTSLEFIE